MFEGWKQKRVQVDEILEKVLILLQNTNKWAKIDKNEYKHLDSELKIKYGEESGYETSYMSRCIIEPENLKIPFRFRKRFDSAFAIIDDRRNESTPLQFLNEYLDGEYSYAIIFERNDHPAIKAWLQEQEIFDFYIRKKVFWFKNDEDALAIKLRWVK